jgi:hypothetical protein
MSLLSLSGYKRPDPNKKTAEIRARTRYPYGIRTCVSCHSGPGAVRKRIPFHDYELMDQFLAAKPDKGHAWIKKALSRLNSRDDDFKMPPPDAYTLTAEDRREVQVYLESFLTKP